MASTGTEGADLVLHFSFQFAKETRQILLLVVRIQAAGIGQDPDDRVTDLALLATHDCFWLIEGETVSAQTKDCQDLGTIAPHLNP